MSQNVLEDLLDAIAITNNQLPYLSFSNNLRCMYKWKNAKYNQIFFLVTILQSEESSILTCWTPSKTPRHTSRTVALIISLSQPKSQP